MKESADQIIARMQVGVAKMDVFLAVEAAKIEGESNGFKVGMALGFLAGVFLMVVLSR